MIKVMIVDDEPFIRQGLSILINWKLYGFDVCTEASNGKEAVTYLQQDDYDLVITDIRMPEMDGLELIKYTWENISQKIRFIILSGFSEFEYAKKAMKYDVVEYVLKPVQKEELIKVLEEYKDEYFQQAEYQKKLEYSKKIIFDRHLAYLLKGKKDKESLDYVIKYFLDASILRYISIDAQEKENESEWQQEDEFKVQRMIYDALKDYLGKYWYHAYQDLSSNENEHGVSFIYTKTLSDAMGLTEKEYINNLYEFMTNTLPFKIILYIGQKVDKLDQISESVKSAEIARTFHRFTIEKEIAYYDDIIKKINLNKNPINKYCMDELIHSIEENDAQAIDYNVDEIYKLFRDLVTEPEIIKIYLDYLLFNLMNLAKELYADFDQNEVYNMIYQVGFDKITVRGSAKHFKSFALEFSNFLCEHRKYAMGGVLTEVEREITEHYMDNLSLKSLSEKYYVNSAYLGQIFKKQYGNSFKDYLNNYRIDRAAEMLLRSDEKIYIVASATGFNNTDYFISKFVQMKGVTPLQYRKQSIKK